MVSKGSVERINENNVIVIKELDLMLFITFVYKRKRNIDKEKSIKKQKLDKEIEHLTNNVVDTSLHSVNINQETSLCTSRHLENDIPNLELTEHTFTNEMHHKGNSVSKILGQCGDGECTRKHRNGQSWHICLVCNMRYCQIHKKGKFKCRKCKAQLCPTHQKEHQC